MSTEFEAEARELMKVLNGFISPDATKRHTLSMAVVPIIQKALRDAQEVNLKPSILRLVRLKHRHYKIFIDGEWRLGWTEGKAPQEIEELAVAGYPNTVFFAAYEDYPAIPIPNPTVTA